MKKVLVVDDQAHIVRVIKRMLEKRGLIIDTAPNGVVGLEKIEQYWYKVIVTDYQMPKMDGITMAEKIRDTYPDNDVFIILTTAIADENLQIWADEMPNCIYLEKPVSIRRLGDILIEHFDSLEAPGDISACS